jgi:hypothetical protein
MITAVTPIRSALELVVLRNSQVEHEGIDLAIFSDRVIIDSKGGVRIMKERDFEGGSTNTEYLWRRV